MLILFGGRSTPPKSGWRIFWFHLPVSVPFAVLVITYGVQVWEGDDVTAVRAQPLLVKAALPVLQLPLVLVGDADVGVIVLHADSGHSGMVALQELMVHPLIMLHTDRDIKTVRFVRVFAAQMTTERVPVLVWGICMCCQVNDVIQTGNHTFA